jgi:Nucleotidyltransferase of unknown function (DUF6036)
MADEFTSAEIRRLFDLLEAEVGRRGVAASMYVVGGAAIALAYDAGRRTKDIDATMVPEEAVLEAAKSVAEAEGLPPNWLNTHAAGWVPPRPKKALNIPMDVGLRIDIASPQTLLAMKLVASRNRDIPDIKLLAEAIGVTDPSEMADLVRNQYGEDQLELVHGGYEDMLIWCETLAQRFWT